MVIARKEFNDGGLTLDGTVVSLRAAQHGSEKLMSRAQARRLTEAFDTLKDAVLDFEGVTQIGQAFADELFRVFAPEHPQVRLTPVNASPAVGQMISRVLSGRATSN